MSSTLLDASVSPPAPMPRRCQLWRAAAIPLALVVAGMVVALTMSLAQPGGRSGPIDSGAFGGPIGERNLVLNFRHQTGHLVTTPGAQARLLASLENEGARAAIVTSIDTDAVTSAIRWSVYRTVPGGDATGAATRWRDFPAFVPAHGLIRLQITIHRPSYCQRRPISSGIGSFYGGTYVAHWSSLLHNHSTMIDTHLGSYNIQVC